MGVLRGHGTAEEAGFSDEGGTPVSAASTPALPPADLAVTTRVPPPPRPPLKLMREVCGIPLVQSLFSFSPKQGKIPIIGPDREQRHTVTRAFSKGRDYSLSVLEVTSACRGLCPAQCTWQPL